MFQYWDHKMVHFLKISCLVARTWLQNDFSLVEKGSRSWKNGWFSKVNWLEEFSIKAEEVTGFLGTNWTKNGREEGEREEKSNFEKWGAHRFNDKVVGVWVSPTSWAFVIGLSGDSGARVLMFPSSVTWPPTCLQSLPRPLLNLSFFLEASVWWDFIHCPSVYPIGRPSVCYHPRRTLSSTPAAPAWTAQAPGHTAHPRLFCLETALVESWLLYHYRVDFLLGLERKRDKL